MTVLKGADIDRFLAAPRPDRPVILIYGTDAGLVSERCRMLVAAAVADPGDPFAVVQIDGDLLSRDPVRLVDEAHTLPMFGGRRLIRVRAGERPFVAAVSPLLADPPRDSTVLIEAGDLKKTSPLRTEAERSPHAAVIACYPDGEADLRRLIVEEARSAGLTVEPAALAHLAGLLGGDRAASRAEIRKICLYCHGSSTITLADVEAIAGDSLDLGAGDLVDAALGGQPAELDVLIMRSTAMGLPSQQVLTILGRQIASLHKALLAVAEGASRRQAAERFEPPVFGPRRDRVERQLGLWTPARLERAMDRTAEAAFEARVNARMAGMIASRLLLSLANQAQPRR
ncbi:DNA polymerase III subunit delta [Phreatobacter sp.]|uniref:DNA polymerase III subunit delta n=1 Tax=Phreatobacter sp. TaxID=1966341 RepID=UPI003F7282D0